MSNSTITFNHTDFEVFEIPGLAARMDALIELVRPKLTRLGDEVSPYLSTICGEEMFPHVAKHIRRTVHPPNDTWVAWSNQKRGYKAQPHFQVGLWSTHLFIQFAIIYESHHKAIFANHFVQQMNMLAEEIPDHYFWSLDHTKPEVVQHQNMSKKQLKQATVRLKQVKKAEICCGLQIMKDDPILQNEAQLVTTIEQTFATLLPLYRISF